jgi:hypothetical protein
VHSFCILPDSADMTLRGRTAATATGTNRKTVMLLHVHIHVALIESEFASVIKLLVKRLFMMRDLHLRKLMQETIVSVARFRFVEPFVVLLLSLGPNWHCLICWFLIICTVQPLLLSLIEAISRQLSSIPGLHK